MRTRNILYVLTLMAYTLSLAHSVIPHHHHNSAQEATAHHHHKIHGSDHANYDGNHNTQHQHKGGDTGTDPSHDSDTSHFFFLSHDLNVDALTEHASADNPAKVKKAAAVSTTLATITSFEQRSDLTFHPPRDESLLTTTARGQHSLRGPPSLLM